MERMDVFVTDGKANHWAKAELRKVPKDQLPDLLVAASVLFPTGDTRCGISQENFTVDSQYNPIDRSLPDCMACFMNVIKEM